MRLWTELELEAGEAKVRCAVRAMSMRGSFGESCGVDERISEGVEAWRAKRVAERAGARVMKEPPSR